MDAHPSLQHPSLEQAPAQHSPQPAQKFKSTEQIARTTEERHEAVVSQALRAPLLVYCMASPHVVKMLVPQSAMASLQ
jgi:hypothetical protein